MTATADVSYDSWLRELLRIARERELEWLVSPGSDNHRTAFAQGWTPQEELAALQRLCEWRGCACGGG